MPSTSNIVHGFFAFGSFSAALASLVISARLGALQFIKENLIDGLCTDVWDGFFLSPTNLVFIAFLSYLPIHCYTNHSPATLLFLSAIMGIPSYLFYCAVLLETSPVILPLGIAIGLCTTFGLAEYRLACQNHPRKPSVSSSPLKQNKLSLRKNKSVEFNLKNNSDFANAPLIQNNHLDLVSPHNFSFLSVPKSKPSPLSKRKRRES